MTPHGPWKKARHLRNSQRLYRQFEPKWQLFILYMSGSVHVYECVHVWGTHVSASVHAYVHKHAGVWGWWWESSSVALHITHWGKVSQQNLELDKLLVRWPVCSRGALSASLGAVTGGPPHLTSVEVSSGDPSSGLHMWLRSCWAISPTLEGSFAVYSDCGQFLVCSERAMEAGVVEWVRL